MNVTIEDAREGDVEEISLDLRDFELRIENTLGIAIVTEKNIQEASWAKTVRLDGKVMGIVGVQMDGLIGRRGHLWLVAARDSVYYPTSFGRYSLRLLREIRGRFDALHGVVCHDFPESVRWLRWLGFTILPPHGANGLTFSQFYWSR